MRVAKIACGRCGSKSLREDGGSMRCVQCGRVVPGTDKAPQLAGPNAKRPGAKWEL